MKCCHLQRGRNPATEESTQTRWPQLPRSTKQKTETQIIFKKCLKWSLQQYNDRVFCYVDIMSYIDQREQPLSRDEFYLTVHVTFTKIFLNYIKVSLIVQCLQYHFTTMEKRS